MNSTLQTIQPAGTTVQGLVSVILSACDPADSIAETLQSLFAQSYRHLEIIVVVTGATDQTLALLQGHGERLTVLREANSGSCSALRNLGLRMAHGEFVTFVDTDDLLQTAKIERQVEFLRRYPDCAMVLTNYRNFSAAGPAATSHFETCELLMREPGVAGKEGIVLSPERATRILAVENFSSAAAPLFRRTVFAAVAAFDEALQASEDFELIYRVGLRHGIGIIDEVGFLRRMHAENTSQRTLHILEQEVAARHQLLRREENPETRRLLQNAVAELHMALAEFASRSAPMRAWRHLVSALLSGYQPNRQFLKTSVQCFLACMIHAPGAISAAYLQAKSAVNTALHGPTGMPAPVTERVADQTPAQQEIIQAIAVVPPGLEILQQEPANEPIERRKKRRPWRKKNRKAQAKAAAKLARNRPPSAAGSNE